MKVYEEDRVYRVYLDPSLGDVVNFLDGDRLKARIGPVQFILETAGSGDRDITFTFLPTEKVCASVRQTPELRERLIAGETIVLGDDNARLSLYLQQRNTSGMD